MLAKKDHILVRVDPEQKMHRDLAGKRIATGIQYNENFREVNPVLGQVVQGRKNILAGDWIVASYTYFDDGSPFLISDNIYAIPLDSEVYAVIDAEGNPSPVCGNVLIERVVKESAIEMPPDFQEVHKNRGVVVCGSGAFRRGMLVFFRPFCDLEMVYFWNGEERRFIRLEKEQIVGVLKNS